MIPFVPHNKVKQIPVKDWGKKYRPIRVWCCIKTIYNKSQLLIMQETWGKYCDKLLFMVGDAEQTNIEDVQIYYDDKTVLNNVIRLKLKFTDINRTSPKKDLWEKCWKTYQYLYEYHKNEFEWVITADTDAWFSAYNFKGYAQYFDPNQPWYIGHTLTHNWKRFNFVFNAGGIFAQLSIGSIIKLNKIFKTSEFLNGKRSLVKCTGYGSWQDDSHIGICLKSIGIFPINSLDSKHRARWSIWPYHGISTFNYYSTTWYWSNRFENTGLMKNCCSINAIAFHDYKDVRLRKKQFMELDEMFTEKSRYNWSNHALPPMPTTFLFNTSFNEFDEYFNIKRPPHGQKVWKGVDNLWNYSDIAVIEENDAMIGVKHTHLSYPRVRSKSIMPVNSTCYFLHKTEKMNVTLARNRFKRAQNEIESYKRCKYILLYWIGDKYEADLSNDEKKYLETTEQIIGNENIFIIDYTKTNHVFNDIFIEFNNSKQRWLQRGESMQYQYRWEWNMADIPEMVWSYYEFFNDTFDCDNYDDTYIWSMEWDVLWSGHLGKILIDEISNHLNHTYLAWDLHKNEKNWYHHHKVYPNTILNGITTHLYSGHIQLVRYKPKILSLMIMQIQRKHYVYCETRAILLCMFFSNNTCTYSSLNDKQLNFNHYFGHFQWSESSDINNMHAEIAENSTYKLLHAL